MFKRSRAHRNKWYAAILYVVVNYYEKKKKTCLKVLIFNVKGSTTRLRPISIMSIIIVLCTYILTAFKRNEVRVYSGTYDFSSIRCTPEFKTWKNLIAIRSLCRSRIPIASATCSWQFHDGKSTTCKICSNYTSRYYVFFFVWIISIPPYTYFWCMWCLK